MATMRARVVALLLVVLVSALALVLVSPASALKLPASPKHAHAHAAHAEIAVVTDDNAVPAATPTTTVHSPVHASISSTPDASIPDEAWGYVDVRPQAHLFWWLYGTTATAPSARASRPLVLWLQGGPGASSTGFGNFEEIGPLTVDNQPRNSTWLNMVNLLFIDQPVGTGWSYVDDPSAYTTNVTQIADDLVTIFTAFVGLYPDFQTTPFYVFCESYGGKMTTAFAVALRKAIASGSVKANFGGIALGDSWISPIDYTNTWAEYLYNFNLLDARDLQQNNEYAGYVAADVAAGQWEAATNDWGSLENVIEETTDTVNFYNVLQHNVADDAVVAESSSSVSSSPLYRQYRRHVERFAHSLTPRAPQDDLSAFMNGPIRTKLKIIPANVTWGGQSNDVFTYQQGDFMRPIVDGVDSLLQSGFNVTVYNGQLDLICDTDGTLLWVSRLTWPGLPAWNETQRVPMYTAAQGQNTQGFAKVYKNFAFYWVMNAGHMVPADNPYLARQIVSAVTGVPY